jgi:CRP/FNR family transcriptional regulator
MTLSAAQSVHAATQSRPDPGKFPATLASVFSDRPVEKVGAGQALFWEGDSAGHVFELVEGVLRVFRILGDGRRAITGFLYPGDLVGVSMRDRYLYNAEAVNAVKVRRFSRLSFQEAIQCSPELRPQLFARLCDEMASAQEQMVLLSRKNAEERLCSFLVLLAKRMSDGGRGALDIEIPMTRLDIADYLGLTIETVSRTMTNLVGRGIVNQMGRHHLGIRKLETLRRLAGDGELNDPSMPVEVQSRRAVWPA